FACSKHRPMERAFGLALRWDRRGDLFASFPDDLAGLALEFEVALEGLFRWKIGSSYCQHYRCPCVRCWPPPRDGRHEAANARSRSDGVEPQWRGRSYLRWPLHFSRA